MKHLTQAEYDGLVLAREERDTLRRLLGEADYSGSLESRARALVETARRVGLVLTIEQRSLQPPAMGHYETVVSIRAARGAA